MSVRKRSARSMSGISKAGSGIAGHGRRGDFRRELRDGGRTAGVGSARLCEEARKTPRRALATAGEEAGDVMTELKPLKNRLTEDPEEECKRVDEERALAEALVRLRAAAKLTQAEVARRGRHDPVRKAGGRPTVLRHPAPLRRSDRHAVGGGADRRLRHAKTPAKPARRCSAAMTVCATEIRCRACRGGVSRPPRVNPSDPEKERGRGTAPRRRRSRRSRRSR